LLFQLLAKFPPQGGAKKRSDLAVLVAVNIRVGNLPLAS
jgi:hypothetical protein